MARLVGARPEGRSRRRSTVMGGVGVVVLATAVTLSVLGRDSNRRLADALPATSASGALLEFRQNVRLAMSPLLQHVLELPSLLSQMASAEAPAEPAIATLAGQWANDFATARDLVGRLHAPSGEMVARAQDAFVIGALLYSESARSVQGSQPTVALTRDAARAGLRLRLLGDRAIDAARRLLATADGGASPGEAGLPAEVPPVDALAALNGTAAPVRESPLETISARSWQERALPVLRVAATVLDDASGALRGGGLGPAEISSSWPGRLHFEIRRLEGPVPTDMAAREGAFAVRLGLLVGGESIRALAAGSIEPAKRLRLVADRLSALGRRLFPASVGTLPGSASSGLDPSLLATGGIFDGRPPPLRPGDPVDAGVPGRLRIDPLKVIGGIG